MSSPPTVLDLFSSRFPRCLVLWYSKHCGRSKRCFFVFLPKYLPVSTRVYLHPQSRERRLPCYFRGRREPLSSSYVMLRRGSGRLWREKDGEGHTSTVATSSGMERRARAICVGRALPLPLSTEACPSSGRGWLSFFAFATATPLCSPPTRHFEHVGAAAPRTLSVSTRDEASRSNTRPFPCPSARRRNKVLSYGS